MKESWLQEPVICSSLSNCSLWLACRCFSLLFLNTLLAKWRKTFPYLVAMTSFYWRIVTAAAEAFFCLFFFMLTWRVSYSLTADRQLVYSVYSNVEIIFWNEVFLPSRVAYAAGDSPVCGKGGGRGQWEQQRHVEIKSVYRGSSRGVLFLMFSHTHAAYTDERANNKVGVKLKSKPKKIQFQVINNRQ